MNDTISHRVKIKLFQNVDNLIAVEAKVRDSDMKISRRTENGKNISKYNTNDMITISLNENLF